MAKKFKLSVISAMHYFKLVYRSVLLIGAFVYWLIEKLNGVYSPFDNVEHRTVIIGVIWVVFTA